MTAQRHSTAPSASAAPVATVVKTTVVAKPGDRDGDGWRDEDDFCPDEPEDIDDCNDEDGCPDPDDDDDGIPDTMDRCPMQHDRHAGGDGCPGPLPLNTVVVTESDECWAILEPIYFGKNRSKTGAEARAILDALGAYFRHCDLILTMEIRGRKGIKERPPELATERAEAVRAELVARGIEARRLRVVIDGAPAEAAHGEPWPVRGVEFKATRTLSCGRR